MGKRTFLRRRQRPVSLSTSVILRPAKLKSTRGSRPKARGDQRAQTFTSLLAVLSSSLSSIWPSDSDSGSVKGTQKVRGKAQQSCPWGGNRLLGRRHPGWDSMVGSNNLHTMTPNLKKKRNETKERKITLKNYSVSDSSNWPLVNSQRVNKTKAAETHGLGPTDRFYARIPATALVPRVRTHTLFLNAYHSKFTTQIQNELSFGCFLKRRLEGKKLINFILRTKANYSKIWVLELEKDNVASL